ncbi:glycosyltransferase family A protein [Nocardioides sp. C4-1]|uniref:glycosyltransferase family 2 protein n=1 Tax=Nocardioides sp. C4-1 TaxID=3151851 RepID=UPI003262F8A8
MTEPHPHRAVDPDVDVVIATRHRPEMVREAIAAVAAQDHPGTVRCLVVHDGTEPDRSLVSQDPHRPVQVLCNTRTPGLAGSRNTGVGAGSAPYVAFCDDDDVWRTDKVTRQVARLEQDGSRTVVTGVTIHYRDRVVERVPHPDELTAETLARHRVMAAHPSTVLVRRSALVGDIGPFDEDIPGSYGEDYDWMLRAVAAGPVGVVPAALVDVRWGSSQFTRQWQTIVDALDYLIDKHPVFRADRHALGRLRGQQAFATAALGPHGSAAAIGRALRGSPTEPRAYLAAAVATRMVSADRVLDLLNRRGRGI